MVRMVVWLICCLMLVSCSKSTTNSSPKQSKVVAATGGNVTFAGATLEIPAGALSADATIIVTKTTTKITGFELRSDVYTFSPAGTEFKTSATISIPFTGSGTDLLIFTDDGSGQAPRALETTINGTLATAKVAHFSRFWVGTKGGAASCTSDADCADVRECVGKTSSRITERVCNQAGKVCVLKVGSEVKTTCTGDCLPISSSDKGTLTEIKDGCAKNTTSADCKGLCPLDCTGKAQCGNKCVPLGSCGGGTTPTKISCGMAPCGGQLVVTGQTSTEWKIVGFCNEGAGTCKIGSTRDFSQIKINSGSLTFRATSFDLKEDYVGTATWTFDASCKDSCKADNRCAPGTEPCTCTNTGDEQNEQTNISYTISGTSIVGKDALSIPYCVVGTKLWLKIPAHDFDLPSVYLLERAP